MMIGVLGGGQLGRMLALAGYPLGLRFRFLEPSPEAPAGMLAEQRIGSYEDTAMLAEFAAGLDLATYEFESIPVESVRFLAERVPVYPPAKALEAAQDRLSEKNLFRELEIPTTPFAPVQSRQELAAALQQLGPAVLLKTRRFGYDGKGQARYRTPDDFDRFEGVPMLLEKVVAFQRELSILAVRSRSGAVAFYPLVENHHQGGILRLSLAPAPGLQPKLQPLAEDYARRVLERLDYVGVLAIEFFECEGRLLANEMAPRVHNSGHWSIEGAETSQFENHLRAILDLPLGATDAVGCSAMVNLIGTMPDQRAVLAIPHAHLHLYGKEPRPGRKLGHVTLWPHDSAELPAPLEQLKALIGYGVKSEAAH